MSWIQKLQRDGCVPMQTVGFCTGAALTVIACLTFAAKVRSSLVLSSDQLFACHV